MFWLSYESFSILCGFLPKAGYANYMSRKDFKQSLEIMVDLYIQGDLDPASTTWFGTFLNHSDSDYK